MNDTPKTTPEKDMRPASQTDRGMLENGRVVFPEWRDPADKPSAPPPAPLPPSERIGFAVVGLGRLTLEQILPALGASTNAKLVALVSGDRAKLDRVGQQYGVDDSALYSYDELEKLADNRDVDAVFIVTPNGLHLEHVERCARAGKHILCEKPMATSTADAQTMLDICNETGRKLMIAYRSQFVPHLEAVVEHVRNNDFGALRAITAVNVQTSAANNQWRDDKALAGGGAMPDIGIYCLSAAKFLSGQEPNEVYASVYSPPGDPQWASVEETCSFTLKFASGLVAQAITSYGAREFRSLQLMFERATIEVANAFAYSDISMTLGQRQGDHTVNIEVVLPQANQFVREIEHFADAIINDTVPRTPGEQGVRDHQIVDLIYASARENRPMPIPPLS